MIKRKKMRIELTPEQIAELQYAASMFSIHYDQIVAMATYFIGFLEQGEKLDLTRFINAAQTLQKGFVERIYNRDEDYSREEIAAVFTNVAKLVKANDTVRLNAIRNIIESEYRQNENGDWEFFDPVTETP